MRKVERSRSSEPLSLAFYIHIPYCVKRCGYCDFNTYTPQELKTPSLSLITTPYIDSAIDEIEMAGKEVGRALVPSIFFGGGTPSLIPGVDIARVIKKIRERFELPADAEITVEVNPDSVSREFLETIRTAGVNRISMGMQSAVPHVLAALDRTHNPDNIHKSAALISEIGFPHFSVDLIYGVPGESISDWTESYEMALSLPIDHLSAYALIVETGTKLASQLSRGELALPPEDETAEKYLLLNDAAEARGMNWYELSNWAMPNGECRHNIAYWNGSYWWGVGPGAHSYLMKRRWWNVKHPGTYQNLIKNGSQPIQSAEELTEENLADEFLMLNIRMRAGIEKALLSKRQIDIGSSYLATGHVDGASWAEERLVLTASGRLIADRIVSELLV
jgi:oxygen-independent coproporphyrinogen-3 oxidase